MGMFSWKCRECERSILAPHALTPTNAWMNQATAVLPTGGKVVTGSYDGYGRIDNVGEGTVDINTTEYSAAGAPSNDPDVYHLACWRIVGRPIIYKGGSASALDQGFFYDDRDYMKPEPTDKDDVEYLKKNGAAA